MDQHLWPQTPSACQQSWLFCNGVCWSLECRTHQVDHSVYSVIESHTGRLVTRDVLRLKVPSSSNAERSTMAFPCAAQSVCEAFSWLQMTEQHDELAAELIRAWPGRGGSLVSGNDPVLQHVPLHCSVVKDGNDEKIDIIVAGGMFKWMADNGNGTGLHANADSTVRQWQV